MTGWNEWEIEEIATADEVELATYDEHHELHPPITGWVVRVGADLYVRTSHDAEGGWYRPSRTFGDGRLRVGESFVREVRCFQAFDADPTAVAAAYRAKYAQYGLERLAEVVGPDSKLVTVRVEAIPRAGGAAPTGFDPLAL
ncbi:DUF2255 family protein [Agromyces seonyuensis]|uniref:DUF2255 family protein n=1 Tax=Agromyces seonyuensis TaxID=2662446 RepID=A0A6I4NVQ0_9MICO|nr:DUF2255 family protein [Agromyces seonyuensis]MWB98468.1 DUF2255 family protein [Agromyces seonyuensis]